MTVSTNCVTAFLGAFPADLRATAADGVLLPLDSHAIQQAADVGLPFTTVDDWLTVDDRRDVRARIRACADRWFEAGLEAFTVDGICWPHLDRMFLDHFWEEWVVQDALGAAFVGAGVQQLRFVRPVGDRPSLLWGPADTFGACWEARYGDRLDLVVERVSSRWRARRDLLRRALGKAGRIASTVRAQSFRPPPPTARTGTVTLAVYQPELARFWHLLESVGRDSSAVVLVEPDRALALLEGRNRCVPVHPGPSAAPVPISDRVRQGLDAVARSDLGQPWEGAVGACRSTFEHYCAVRWPRLAGELRAWEDLWRAGRPGVVVTSSLEGPASRLPAEAARRVGIPTLAAPHAAYDVPWYGALSADALLVAHALQRELYGRSGMPWDRLAACRDIVSHYEYETRRAAVVQPHEGVRVLALTNPVSYVTARLISDRFVAHGEQLAALRALRDVPTGVDVRLKVHPGFPDRELVRVAGPDVDRLVLPLDADLVSELDNADLVVGVNYMGSALLHVLAAGKPCVHLWTAAQLVRDHPFGALFAAGGEVLTTASELRRLLSDSLADPGVLADLAARSAAFAETWLTAGDAPSFAEHVHEALVSPPATRAG